MKKILVAFVAFMTLGAFAQAGGDIAPVETTSVAPVTKDFYVGISTTLGESITFEDFESFSSTGYGVQAGYVFYRDGNFDTAVEARYTTILRGDLEFNDVANYGAFVKPGYNFGSVKAYGLVGYTAIDTPIGDTDGFAYGLGASTEVYGYELFIDYVINDDSEFSILGDFDTDSLNNEVLTVGINYKF